MILLKIQLFRERLSENVYARIPIVIVGGFEFTVFQFERMAREIMDVCLRVLKESNKSEFDSYSVRNSVLIISHITFRICCVHIFFDNLSRNSCISYLTDTYVPRFERLKRSILSYCGSSDFLGLVFFACIFSFFLVE